MTPAEQCLVPPFPRCKSTSELNSTAIFDRTLRVRSLGPSAAPRISDGLQPSVAQRQIFALPVNISSGGPFRLPNLMQLSFGHVLAPPINDPRPVRSLFSPRTRQLFDYILALMYVRTVIAPKLTVDYASLSSSKALQACSCRRVTPCARHWNPSSGSITVRVLHSVCVTVRVIDRDPRRLVPGPCS